MVWVIVAVAVLLLGVAAFFAVGRLGSVPEPDDDVYAPTLPEGRLRAEDLRGVKFGVVMRGYDMKQVDALLSRIADQLGAESAAANPDDTRVGTSPTTVADPLPASTRATAGRDAAEAFPAPVLGASMLDNDERRENAES